MMYARRSEIMIEACSTLPPGSHSGQQGKTDKLTYVVFGAIIVAKLVLLVIFAPVMTPDSGGYIGMAQTILSSSAWLQTDVPGFAFRIVGYPIFLAGAMDIAGSAWPYFVVCAQSAVSLFVAWATLRLGDELGLSRGLALIAVAASATSLQFTLDQCILTDSLNASFVILAIVLLVHGARSGRPLLLGHAVLVGLLLSLAFLFREMMQVLIVLFLPLLLVRVASTAKGLRGRAFAAGVVVLALPLMTMEAYKQWNTYRTGERFITTGAQTALLFALTTAARNDAGLFSADAPLDRTMRSHLKDFTYGEVLAANAALAQEGYRGIDIARMATARYLADWQEHPLAMLSLLRAAISENQAKLAVRAVTAVCEIVEWGDSQPQCPDYRDVYRRVFKAPSEMTSAKIAAFIAITIQNILSIAVFAAFLIGVPVFAIVAWRRSESSIDRTPALLSAAFWAVYYGWDFAYVFIHFENRYMAPVIPLSVFGGLLVMQEATRLKWRQA